MTDAPAAVFRHSLDLLLAHDMHGYLDLWHDDAVTEFPFAPPGSPRRLDGITAITAHLIDYPRIIRLAEVAVVALHETADPHVVIAEFNASGTVVATGKPYQMSYIVVLTVTNGKIAHYRDYWNPTVALAALGADMLSLR